MSNFFKCAGLCLLLATATPAADDPNGAVRREFERAYAAAQTAPPVDADSAALQAYVLYPYLQATRLRYALDKGDPDAADAGIEAFVAVHASEPVARELRRAWLLSLAGRGKWPLFVKNYRADVSDIELRCQALNAQLATTLGKEFQGTLLALWMSANKLPPACDAPTAWAQAQNLLTPELLEQRAVLALKAGNAGIARDLIKALPPAQAEPLAQWVALIEQPQAAIDALIAAQNKAVNNAALLDGWTRLARRDQDAALTRFARLITARKFDDAAASPYALALALALSWSRRPEALSYFERVQPGDFNDSAWEWYARAALWAGDWQRVAKLVSAMPAALKAQARWRYWSARAAEQLQDLPAAQAGYAQLMESEDNYFAVMAATRLKKSYAPHPQLVPVDKELLKKVAARPAFQAAHELRVLDMSAQASVEWNFGYESLSPSEQTAALRLADEWGWHDAAIRTASKQNVFNDYVLLYPRPYDKEVKAAAKLSKLPEDLIYAQLRQESLYQSDAVSSANARGLLQMVLPTARTTARRWQRAAPTAEDLLIPAINVPLGAAHLRDLADQYGGQIVVALAAYNAGPNAAARWLPKTPLDADVWMENIPYNETRTYVQRILWHTAVFHWLAHKRMPDTRAWLAQVR